jgi:hypothetical protein
MKPPLHSVMTLVVASIVVLCLLATPVAIDWKTPAIAPAHAVANDLGDTAKSVGDGVADAANSVGDSLGDAAKSVGDSIRNAADRVSDSDSVRNAADHVSDSVRNAADHVSDSVGNAAAHVGDSVRNAADRLGDSFEDPADDVADSLDNGVTVTVREFSNIHWKRVGDSIGDTADDLANIVDTGVTVTVREFREIGWKPGRGSREAGDHQLPLGRGSFSSTTVAAIEPSAGLVIPGCTKEQGAETSCLEAETRDRQITYAPRGDQIYRLQQVEARRYSDRGAPVLVVQGLVSNTSNGEGSVPPLLAIVQDDQGKELMRWTFRAEVERLAPGASTGFRSEMFDPQSKSAKVTIVFAPEQRTMR